MGQGSHVTIAIAILASITVVASLAQDGATNLPAASAPWSGAPVGSDPFYLAYPEVPHSPAFAGQPPLDPTQSADGVFHYPRTDYSTIIDTNGYPVPIPFKYYPQGAVNQDGSGIYQCLVPPDPAELCFCTPPPCYFGTLYVEGVVLDRRSSLERMGLFFDSTGAEVFNTGDFQLQMEAGFRLGFWLCDPCGIDWNVDYFSVQNFQSTVTRSDAVGVTDQFFGFVNGPVPSLTAEYESNLDGIEFTVRTRQWRRLAPLLGIRFLQVNEHFNSLQNVSTRAGSFSQSDNELYGLQFGFQGLIHEGPFWRFETTVKAGPYYNDIDVQATVTPSGGTATTKILHQNTTAFAGDARVGLVCQLGPRANFRIGYQALWIDGIALGPNQNNNISFTTNLQSVDLSGVLYQGGDIGFEVTW